MISNWMKKPWVLPLTLTLVATFLLWRGIAKYKDRLGYNMKSIPLLVASHELPEGHVLSERDISFGELPKRFLPVGTVRQADFKRVIGQILNRPVANGELLLWSSIDVGLGPPGPARKIAKGYRAISISVDPSTSVGQSIRPGDHVDLVMTGNFSGNEGPTTFTLLQNVAVLDVGTKEDENEARYSVVSLMVLPKEVALIVQAERHGKISLALRNPEDHTTPQNLLIVSTSALLESAFRNSLQEERNHSVEIIRGGKVSIDP